MGKSILTIFISLLSVGGISVACDSLCITEVYFDGNDEWIELYMSGNTSFSGELIISGASSSPRTLDLRLDPSNFLILSDKDTVFTGGDFFLQTGFGFQIADTQQIHISASVSGSILDTFFVEESQVLQVNNNKQSFSQYSNIIFPTIIPFGIVTGYLANPGFIDVYENTGTNNSFTGEVDSTGQDMSTGSDPTNRDQIPWDDDPEFIPFVYPEILISEIYPFDTEKFSEYIEISFGGKFSGEIFIDGLGHGESEKSFQVGASSGDRIIITDSASGIIQETKHIVIPSISLTDGGENLILHGQDGHVIDKVVYTKPVKGNAVYFASTSGQFRVFTDSGEPTPGVTQAYKDNLCSVDESFISCSILLQHKDPLHSSNKLNLVASLDKKELSNSSIFQCIRSGDFDSLSGCNPSYTDIPGSGILNIGLQILQNSQLICETETQVNIPDKPQTASCRESYYDGLYHKRKDKYEYLKSNIKKEGYAVSTSGDISLGSTITQSDIQLEFVTGNIAITQVLPNPKGKDNGFEGLEIANIGTGEIILSGTQLYNGKSAKILPRVAILPGESEQVFGNFGLTNKPTCIQLQDTTEILSSVCYGKVSEGVWIQVDKNSLSQQQTSSLQGIDLKEKGDEICILSNGISSKCLSFSGFSYTRKLLKENKKIDELSTKLDQNKEKYTKLSRSTKEQQLELKTQRDSYKRDLNHYKSYRYLLDDFLYNQRNIIYSDPQFQSIRRLLAAGGDSYGVGYLGNSLEEKYLLERNIFPLAVIYYQDMLEHITLSRKGVVDTLGESLIVSGSLVPP